MLFVVCRLFKLFHSSMCQRTGLLSYDNRTWQFVKSLSLASLLYIMLLTQPHQTPFLKLTLVKCFQLRNSNRDGPNFDNNPNHWRRTLSLVLFLFNPIIGNLKIDIGMVLCCRIAKGTTISHLLRLLWAIFYAHQSGPLFLSDGELDF